MFRYLQVKGNSDEEKGDCSPHLRRDEIRPYIFHFYKMYLEARNCLPCGAGTSYLSGAHEFTPDFSVVRVARSLVFCV